MQKNMIFSFIVDIDDNQAGEIKKHSKLSPPDTQHHVFPDPNISQRCRNSTVNHPDHLALQRLSQDKFNNF
jgi:hypothetical protein